ncbi:uncharacterized protein F4812DRAFT_462911 [Daldinia caldariorum]|uniref:uncharacterized protein n=1 Tax=Daldinia caldariorum TaxID=326644 RepID=UPI0020085533|nr:uncharacterized protein F4812DRAFT_462911 [Daldinia caldariorum]KAI1464162.1 hypothetical protein F4812DRAFT_462911 [Daldinia caldariorum]
MLLSKVLLILLLASTLLDIPLSRAMSQPEHTEPVSTATADMPLPTAYEFLVMGNNDCMGAADDLYPMTAELARSRLTRTSSEEAPVSAKPVNASTANQRLPNDDLEADPMPRPNPFTEDFGAYQPSMMEQMMNDYNRDNGGNQIPPFVVCTSLNGRPRVYSRWDIWLAIQAAVHDLSPDVRSGDRSLGAAWPRRLGFQRPDNSSGGAVGSIMEYPIGIHEYDLPLTSLTGETTLMRDRVTFTPDGVYTGVIRYTNETTWHRCYPHGWHSFQRGRAATRSLVGLGVRHVRGLWNRWLGYPHDGYERVED